MSPTLGRHTPNVVITKFNVVYSILHLNVLRFSIKHSKTLSYLAAHLGDMCRPGQIRHEVYSKHLNSETLSTEQPDCRKLSSSRVVVYLFLKRASIYLVELQGKNFYPSGHCH